MNNVKPWANGPLELLRHAEGHLRANTDFDRRMALISFDNSIETSITTYLQLHPWQREGREYERRDVDTWLTNYHSKVEFLETHASRLRQPMKVTRDEIIWYHKLRNEIYHGGNGLVPEEKMLHGIRRVALWAFSILFGVKAEELVTAKSASPPEPVLETQQDRLSGGMALVDSYIKFEKILGTRASDAGLDRPGPQPQDVLDVWKRLAPVLGSVPASYSGIVRQARDARNSIVHGRPADLSEEELQGLASDLDRVTRLVAYRTERIPTAPERAAKRPLGPLQAALEQIEQDIGAEAAGRLREFLPRAQRLGMRRNKNAASFSYRAPSWRSGWLGEPPKRALTTVFFLIPDPGDPCFAFPARGQWERVVGLQAGPLVERLKQVGCNESPPGGNWGSLTLYLKNHNSAEMFAELYDVTADVIGEMKASLRGRGW